MVIFALKSHPGSDAQTMMAFPSESQYYDAHSRETLQNIVTDDWQVKMVVVRRTNSAKAYSAISERPTFYIWTLTSTE